MELAPNWPAPHLEAANALIEMRRPKQAALEVAEAFRRDPTHSSVLPLCSLLRQTENVSLIPASPYEKELRLSFLESLIQCRGLGPVASEALEVTILELDPGNELVAVHRIRRLLRAHDKVRALSLARAFHERHPNEQATTLLAEALRASDRIAEGLALLQAYRGLSTSH